MRLVLALGGNALLRRGQSLEMSVQRANARAAAASIAQVAERHEVVVTHGNGPQVGLLALQNEAYQETRAYPLDVLGAETEGMIGYLLEQELGRHLPPDRLVTVLTQVVVDPSDPAFGAPTKFVGPAYDEHRAQALAPERGWSVAVDGAAGWRRVVPSPLPSSIVEIDVIQLLVDKGITVICAGGGGIPVANASDGGWVGVEAVVDKDLTACLLATELQADGLVLLTDVAAVMDDWGEPTQRAIGTVTPEELRGRTFPAGSMGPKVEAVCSFVEAGGSFAAIGRLADVVDIVGARAGTQVRARG